MLIAGGKKEFRQCGQGRSFSDDLSFELRPSVMRSTQQRKEGNPGKGFSSCKHLEVVTSLESSKAQVLLCDSKKVKEGRSSRKLGTRSGQKPDYGEL